MKCLILMKAIEGDGEYQGKFESIEDRIKRHFTKESVLWYKVTSINY